MRRMFGVATLAALSLLAETAIVAAPPPAPKSSAGTIVIVFKDGHQQSFKLADVERIEFPGAAIANTPSTSGAQLPPRGHFLGKWECGDGNGGTFFITLKENGEAWRSIGDIHGKWAFVDGAAQVTWDDGKLDAIRKVGSRYQKFAYAEGKSFTDQPDNVTNARNTDTRPI